MADFQEKLSELKKFYSTVKGVYNNLSADSSVADISLQKNKTEIKEEESIGTIVDENNFLINAIVMLLCALWENEFGKECFAYQGVGEIFIVRNCIAHRYGKITKEYDNQYKCYEKDYGKNREIKKYEKEIILYDNDIDLFFDIIIREYIEEKNGNR